MCCFAKCLSPAHRSWLSCQDMLNNPLWVFRVLKMTRKMEMFIRSMSEYADLVHRASHITAHVFTVSFCMWCTMLLGCNSGPGLYE